MTTTQAVRKLSNTASVSVSRLKASWGPLKRILSFSPADDMIAPKKSLAVSLEKGGVSVVYGSRFLSKIQLTAVRRYASEEGKYPQPEDLVSSLALAANDLSAAKTGISLSIPKAWTIIRTAEFPSTVKENLPDVVFYEIDRLTPFMPDECFFDFHIVKEQDDRLTVLLMAAKSDVVTPYISALEGNGFKVGSLTVDLSGMGTLCRYVSKGGDAIFFRMDKDGYEGAMFVEGAVAQTISSKGHLTEEGAGVDAVAAEIAEMIDTAKGQDRKPQVFALISDSDPSLKEEIRSRVNFPLKFLRETDLGLKIAEGQKDISYPAVGCLLESLWPDARGFNLLRKGRYEKPKTPVALSAVLLLAILVVGALNVMAPMRLEEKRLQSISEQLAVKKKGAMKVESLKKELDSLKGEISTINGFKQDNPVMLNLLKQLTVILPKTTWLTRVRTTDTTVQIEGYSDNATSLLPKLEASPYLKKVEFASPTFRDRRMNADRFNIKMEIEGIGKPDGGGGKKGTKTGAGNGKK